MYRLTDAVGRCTRRTKDDDELEDVKVIIAAAVKMAPRRGVNSTTSLVTTESSEMSVSPSVCLFVGAPRRSVCLFV